ARQHLDERRHEIGAHHVKASVCKVDDARHSENQRHAHGKQEQEHADAQSAHHLYGYERTVSDPWEQTRCHLRGLENVPERYLFLAAAARSCATSSQLLMRSLPWISSMSATIGLPSSPIFTTPTHCGGIACWSQPRMMTVPRGNSISNPSLNTALTLSGSVAFVRLMASAMM